jgi:hypothetical protein
MPHYQKPTESHIRRALLAYADDRPDQEIREAMGYDGDGWKVVLRPYLQKYGVARGYPVPAAVYKIGVAEVAEPEHVKAHKRLRRGFNLPKNKEQSYIDLLKSGLSIAEARARLGIA